MTAKDLWDSYAVAEGKQKPADWTAALEE